MNVREYTEADFDRIRDLHEQSGIDYQLPTFPRSEFFSRRVIGVDGEVGMAAFLKLTAEAFLICDPHWRNPAWRFEALRQLSHQCNSDAKEVGVTEVTAFLPPKLVGKFGRRLGKLGWEKIRNDWQCLYHVVS
jgi:hypothetical protein